MENFDNLPFIDQAAHFETISSTQTTARKLILENKVQGNFLIIADKQDHAKGRSESHWFSPQGGLWFTLGLKNIPVESSLSIFTGINMHKALTALYPDLTPNLQIKWPNDIYYDESKICGIIINSVNKNTYHLVGLGLNTNITDFPSYLNNSASSLEKIIKDKVSHRAILQKFVNFFFENLTTYIESRLTSFLEYYHQNSYLLNKKIILETPYECYQGEVRGINPQGAILLKLKNGYSQPFFSGTVRPAQ